MITMISPDFAIEQLYVINNLLLLNLKGVRNGGRP